MSYIVVVPGLTEQAFGPFDTQEAAQDFCERESFNRYSTLLLYAPGLPGTCDACGRQAAGTDEVLCPPCKRALKAGTGPKAVWEH